ncbi:MAG: HAMP domain-containing sensor histidine kinase [Eubacteriales bacterium]|nr:HAMP domain-containing sensor histidine kinase [Eubacteriales bacterium]
MKTKRKNYWSFFWRVGAGFLAFYLAVMSVFTLLLSWQRAYSMAGDMSVSESEFQDWVKLALTDADGASLAERLGEPFVADRRIRDRADIRITETGVLSASGEVLQSNSGWLRAVDPDWQEQIDAGGSAQTYPVAMEGQPAPVYDAIVSWLCGEDGLSQRSVEGWLKDGRIYPKRLLIQRRKSTPEQDGWVADGAPRAVACTYDARLDEEPAQTYLIQSAVHPSNGTETPAQLRNSLSSPRRMALRAQVTGNTKGTGNLVETVRPWRVNYYSYRVVVSAGAPGGFVIAQYAAEGYPIKANLPILMPVWGFGLLLALLFAAVLAAALLRVWRRQERVEQARRDTTAAIAHELKTPLSALSATAELLSGDMAADKRAYYMEQIRAQAARMDGSVKRMLDLSRLEAGAQRLRPERVSVAALAREQLDALAPLSGEITTVALTDGADETEADRALLSRAFDSLLGNAVRFTPPGGRVAVRVENGVCAVENTGAPIPQDALPRLWDAYYQADPARADGGAGLGLAVAKAVFELHGWPFGAENTPEGPRFWFRFGK